MSAALPPAGAETRRTGVPAWQALASAALAAAAFICMDATIKSLSPHFDAIQLTFLRFLSGSVFALAIWARQRSPLPRGPQWKLHLLRSGLLLFTLTSYFHALTVLPLAQTVAISYMAPIFISLLAIWLLRERPSASIGWALLFGLAGTGVALWPQLSASHTPELWGVAAAAFSAVAFAGVMVMSRMQAQRDSLATILLIQNVLPAVALAVPAALTWRPVAWSHLPAIVLAGALATVGLLAVTWAFRHIEASRAAPMEYTGLIWAGLLGYFLFGEVPTVWTLASAALIVTGCLLLLRRH